MEKIKCCIDILKWQLVWDKKKILKKQVFRDGMSIHIFRKLVYDLPHVIQHAPLYKLVLIVSIFLKEK